MEKRFTLYTPDKTRSYPLNTRRTLATEPTGLGNKFNISQKETSSKVYMTNVKPDFEPIKLKVYFNADGSSGYANYKNFLDFFTACGGGLFVFENFDGITKKFCDVVLETAPKSEISEDGVFAEDFTFKRFSYWYEEVNESFAIKSVNGNVSRFPLSFPFGFRGKKFNNKFTVVNNFYEDAPIVITIKGDIAENISIFIINARAGKIVGEIQLATNSVEGKTIIIDATTKKISMDYNATVTNGYSLTNKTKNSFLYLPRGEYEISANIKETDEGEINISIKRYLLD